MADDPVDRSWWVGLSREELRQAVRERAAHFRGKGFNDFLGAQMMRDEWDIRPTARKASRLEQET